MRKLKLFSLIVCALFATQMWGAITCKTITSGDGEVYLVTPANMYTYYNSGNGWVTNASGGEISSGSYYSAKNGNNNSNYINPETETTESGGASGITLKTADNRSARFYFTGAIKVSAFIGITGSGRTATITVYKKSDNSEVKHTTGQSYGSSGAYEKLEVTGLSASVEYYAKVTATNDLCLYAMKFFAPSCSDPNASIIDDAAGYVGDAIDLEYSSDNTSDIVWDIKKGGVATSDASISEGKFTATVAGTYVVTATQAADGTHCEAEESVTLNIASAEKVETVTINNAAETAHLNEEVELKMTAENATQYKWYVKKDAGEYAEVATTAGYTFSATEAGSYTIKCAARNDFNKDAQENPTWVESSNTHTITVTIGTDATLSALAVTGKTLTPAFDAATFAYAIGEIGVYEKLTITYTVNDAPYATAVLKNNIITDGADTVVVTAEDGETVNNYIINYTRAAATELVSISGSTTWDWANAGSKLDDWSATSFPAKDVDTVNLADVPGINNNENFKADALLFKGQGANRGGYAQGPLFIFRTTIAGKIVVTFSNTGTSDRPYRYVAVNGVVDTTVGSKNTTKVPSAEIDVNAGLVKIEGSFEEYNNDPQYLAVSKITFTATQPTALDNTEAGVKAVKRLENGMLVIEKNGVRYNAMGQIIR